MQEKNNIISVEYFKKDNIKVWLSKFIPYDVDSCLYLPEWLPMKKQMVNETYPIETIAESLNQYWKNGNFVKIIFLSHTEAFSVYYIKIMNEIINYMRENYKFLLTNFLYVAGAHPVIDNIEKYKTLCISENFNTIETILINFLEVTLNETKGVDFTKIETTPALKYKKFISLNGVPRLFRLILTGQLIKNNLLDHAYYTLWYTVENNYIRDITGDNEHRNLVEYAEKQFPTIAKKSLDLLKLNKNFFPMYLYTPVIGHFSEKDIFFYNDSYFSLVNETVFAENKGLPDDIFYDCYDFSEKLFRAIKFKHPFILAARPNSLSVLKKYGYKTFHPYINENYDSIENDEDRLLAIVEEVKRLCDFTDAQWLEWQVNVKDIVEHNFNVLHTVGVKAIHFVPDDN